MRFSNWMLLAALVTGLPAAGSEPSQGAARANEEKKTDEDTVAKLKKAMDVLEKLKISGYIQPQYVHDDASADEISGSGTKNRDQFSVRRARVKFTYQATPTARFVVTPDFSSSSVSLKDGYLELIEPWTAWKHTLTAGQFVWPFGFELMYSSSAREVPERSRMVNTLFPGARDRGLMLSGSDPRKRLNYRLAVVNGTGTAQNFDFNRRKDVVGRLGGSLGPVNLGVSVYRGSELVATSANPKGEEFDRQRAGLDVQWRTPLRGLELRGEYIRGRQAPSAGTSRTSSHAVEGWNLYAVQKLGKRHRLALRLDEYDPDTGVSGNATTAVTPSYLFQWDSHSTVMLAYELIESETSDRDDDVFTMRYQFSF